VEWAFVMQCYTILREGRLSATRTSLYESADAVCTLYSGGGRLDRLESGNFGLSALHDSVVCQRSRLT